MLGESPEFRRLRHAVEKAEGERERAIRNVCRLYGVNTLDATARHPGNRVGPARVSPFGAREAALDEATLARLRSRLG